MAVEEVAPVAMAGSVGWVAVGGFRDAETGERSLMLVRGVGGGGGGVALGLGLLLARLSSELYSSSIGEGGTTRHSW